MISRALLLMTMSLILILISNTVSSAELDETCVLNTVATGNQELTIADIRGRCKSKAGATLVEHRKKRELSLFGDEFSILLHRDNYILPIAHNNEQGGVANELGNARELDDEEIKFQISIRTLLLNSLPFNAQLYAAYTNQSHWQAYNAENSRPFRETNHQPELFIDFPLDKQFRGLKLNTLRFAFNHQSNGQSGPISRSWNRTYAELLMSTTHSQLNLRTWWQISNDEDNPDIDHFMGNFQIDGLRKFGKHQLHWKARHNLDSDSKGALELGWSRRIGGRDDLRLYLQYFTGYGESLIDYNRTTKRIGLGFKIGLQ